MMHDIRIFFCKLQNFIIRKCYEISRVDTNGRKVYLTFDDGPEPVITEFVLAELAKYGFKATFFCRGDNAEKNQHLLNSLKNDGHRIANHSYSHLHSYSTSGNDYVTNVCKCDSLLQTNLFRPPYGSLTFSDWFKLRNRYVIVYWSINSGDSDMERFNIEKSFERLKQTKQGDVVLFHFCQRHANETKALLPKYLEWLKENDFSSCVID